MQDQQRLEKQLSRLTRLQGSDAGVFVLAAHAFVEGEMKRRTGHHDTYWNPVRFGELVDAYRDLLKPGAHRQDRDVAFLTRIAGQHKNTHTVRHEFGELDTEQARAATADLLRFCEASDLGSAEGRRQLNEALESWEERRSFYDQAQELKRLGFKLLMSQRENKEINSQLAELSQRNEELAAAEAEFQALDAKVRALEKQKDKQAERLEKVRRERYEAEEERRRLSEQVEELSTAREYLEGLARLTHYTRSRMAYEQNLIRPTREQENILSQVDLNSDFLVKGAAGTGKTLVLLKALEKAKRARSEELGIGSESRRFLFLTYTKTLAKYNSYVASLLFDEFDEDDRISTVDSFFADLLGSFEPDARIDYQAPAAFAKSHDGVVELSAEELAAELEDFILGNMVTEEEYLQTGIKREGMGKPLTNDRRKEVWALLREWISRMEEDGVYSKQYANRRILAALSGTPKKYQHVFVDEAQDLSPADLAVLRSVAAGSVILAGDQDQAIYKPGFSFRRANIDISGRTRILKTNFRNTAQIHDLGESYRTLNQSGYDRETAPEAFRGGPTPELYEADNTDTLIDELCSRAKLFIEELEYAPENIGIVVPTKKEIDKVERRLADLGYAAGNPKDSNFNFEDPALIRVTTYHSSKGLDFPVVLLLLSRPPHVPRVFDSETRSGMVGNLIYVAMTRAMDQLNIFVRSDSKSSEIARLREAYEDTVARWTE